MTKFSHLTDEELVRMGLADINPVTSTDLEIELLNRFGEASAALAEYEKRGVFDIEPHHLELLRYLESVGMDDENKQEEMIDVKQFLESKSLFDIAEIKNLVATNEKLLPIAEATLGNLQDLVELFKEITHQEQQSCNP